MFDHPACKQTASNLRILNCIHWGVLISGLFRVEWISVVLHLQRSKAAWTTISQQYLSSLLGLGSSILKFTGRILLDHWPLRSNKASSSKDRKTINVILPEIHQAKNDPSPRSVLKRSKKWSDLKKVSRTCPKMAVPAKGCDLVWAHLAQRKGNNIKPVRYWYGKSWDL